MGGATTTANAQTSQRPPVVARAPTGNGPIITALVPDLQPIPSRITHGVVSVRNTGTAPSAPSVVTVNCHLPGQNGGCPEIPAAAMAAYTDAAFPNKLVVQVPAIQPGHVYNHNLSFWNGYNMPSGAYVFEFVADASATNNESNEANNAQSYNWVKP
jgi:hypothetical protein